MGVEGGGGIRGGRMQSWILNTDKKAVLRIYKYLFRIRIIGYRNNQKLINLKKKTGLSFLHSKMSSRSLT